MKKKRRCACQNVSVSCQFVFLTGGMTGQRRHRGIKKGVPLYSNLC
ncbi:hypothetical protein HMPREF9012_1139 [Bacteroidetes bacterium oral taxon 272 str. F0290]|nr:hypothetical protein HMPREF9012_1139 [Bacteroidetes bacterium oral taxon 272 str. F0290]